MPDRPGYTQLKIVEVHIDPPNPQQLAHAQSCGSGQQNQGALPRVEFGGKKLKFCEFEYIRNALPLRALTHELDRILDPSTRNASRD